MLRITRRDFLKYCSIAAGALGLSASTLMRIESVYAKEDNLTSGGQVPDVVWISGAACTGCTMSLLNTVFYTTIDDLLLNKIDLEYLDTAMATAGAIVDGTQYPGANSLKAAQDVYNAGLTWPTSGKPFVLCVEGAIQMAAPLGASAGDYCRIGSLTAPGGPETMLANVTAFANNPGCVAILSIGTCSSFGGIPGARGNVTNAQGVGFSGTALGGALVSKTDMRKKKGLAEKLINISGCPPHPDWIVGAISYILDTYITLPPVNRNYQPVDYGYQDYQCNAGPCPWRYNNTQNRAHNTGSTLVPEPDYNPRYPEGNSRALGVHKYTGTDLGCLGILGCKGRKTKADCSKRRWNSDAAENYGVNWCVGSRGGCHGCTEPTFPDKVGKFFTFA
jgi:hydrogenase small subunit